MKRENKESYLNKLGKTFRENILNERLKNRSFSNLNKDYFEKINLYKSSFIQNRVKRELEIQVENMKLLREITIYLIRKHTSKRIREIKEIYWDAEISHFHKNMDNQREKDRELKKKIKMVEDLLLLEI